MSFDDCFELGYIIKAHGLKGEVQVFLDTDAPQAYRKLESVFVQQGQQLVPFFIESISINASKAILAFDEIHHIDEANALKGSKLYLPLDFLPELPDDEFYLHELVGFSIIDASTHQTVGEVMNVLETGPQLILQIELEGKEVLIPYAKDLQVSMDKAAKTVVLKISDGLLDVYLSGDED